ncbi:MAG: ABC transporter permease subunit [Raoultibacter sp.]|jgi:ABC-2 type transport system permease protein
MRTVCIHELKQNIRMLAIWSLAVSVLVLLCMIIFPDMEKQADDMNEMFASMGGFTQAFGMDKISIADPMGYYGIEGGAILGLGGALFAALLGSRMLSKEETEHTSEFLLTHPLSRLSVVGAKLLALIVIVLAFNGIAVAFGLASFAMIDEAIDLEGFWMLHLAQCILHLEVACVCFAASAFMKRSSVGFGLGVALLLYFMNIIGNLSSDTEFVRYITPFGYADAANVLPDAAINTEYLMCGLAYMLVALVIAFIVYTRKDIAA